MCTCMCMHVYISVHMQDYMNRLAINYFRRPETGQQKFNTNMHNIYARFCILITGQLAEYILFSAYLQNLLLRAGRTAAVQLLSGACTVTSSTQQRMHKAADTIGGCPYCLRDAGSGPKLKLTLTLVKLAPQNVMLTLHVHYIE